MALQHLVNDVGTSFGPSWTVHGNAVWMAWKGQDSDTGIYVAATSALQPDPVSGEYSFGPQKKVLDLATPSSPAIASWPAPCTCSTGARRATRSSGRAAPTGAPGRT